MITLRIEHAIRDFDQWKVAFDSFDTVRQSAGVRGHAIRRPVDDPHYLMLDLEFDTTDAAEAFGLFLVERVWSSPDSAPALAGVPRTRVLEVREDVADAVPIEGSSTYGYPGGGRASL